jgi:hypothetical protein
LLKSCQRTRYHLSGNWERMKEGKRMVGRLVWVSEEVGLILTMIPSPQLETGGTDPPLASNAESLHSLQDRGLRPRPLRLLVSSDGMRGERSGKSSPLRLDGGLPLVGQESNHRRALTCTPCWNYRESRAEGHRLLETMVFDVLGRYWSLGSCSCCTVANGVEGCPGAGTFE